MANVSDPKFWKERLDSAVELFHSVFLTGGQQWEQIRRDHEDILGEHIPNNVKVLDAGCGYGRFYPFFKEKECDYHGVDISPDFIELAINTYGDHFSVGNLKHLPFKDDEFDYAFCVSIEGMVVRELGSKEWEFMRNELIRVAKKVIILEYGSSKEIKIYEKAE